LWFVQHERRCHRSVTGLADSDNDNAAMIPTAPAASPGPEFGLSRRRIATNFLSLAGTSVLGLVITILISVYVRRILGPAAIGQVSWAMAAIAYLTTLVTPGLATVGQRELARAPERSQSLVALILTLQTLLAVAVYGLVVIVAILEPRGPIVSLLLLIQGLTLFLAAWNNNWVLQAHERMAAPSLAALALNALQLPALMLAIDGPGDLMLYAALALPFTFAGLVFNFWYLARKGLLHPLRLRPTLRGARGLLRDAWPLALAGAAVMVTANSGTFVLGFTDGDEAVGQFSSAFRLMLVAAVVTAALWNAYFPAFSRSQGDPDQATALSREYLKLLVWMGMPIAALGWALGRHVVELLYGPAFAPAGHYFEWLCLAVGLTFMNYGIVATLVPWGRSDLQFRIVAVAAVLNLGLNVAAAPLFGAWGAVAATLASEMLVVLLGVTLRRRLGLFWHPILPIVLPPLLCSAAVAGVLVALPRSLDHLWWLQLTAALLVLGLCLLAFEWQTLRSLRWKSR
jgi:O-antigen/teichoic acid export membrane protein